jgi:hypothetical protein
MFSAIKKNRGFKITGAAILFFFAAGMIFPGSANLNTARAAVFGLPDYQEPVPLSNSYTLPILKGLKLDPANPLRIEFIIDTADNRQVGPNEASKLIRYFLAGLTIPEDDLWVNLSVYEQDRIVPPQLGETDLGKDLLSQDYILKQLMASVIYPESDTGKNYWAKTYQEVLKSFGTTSLPVDTFNKVWIIPDKAELSERKNFVFITQANLKAVMEEDLLALEKSVRSVEPVKPVVGLESSNRPNGLNRHNRLNKQNWPTAAKVNKIASQVMREIILPKVNIDVNQGRNFAMLRQIYHSLVLAAWFKKKLKESFYKNYIDKNKTAGIDLKEKGAKDKIYNLYVEAFKKGMYSIIKPETDPATKKRVRRRYFSGGVLLGGSSAISSAMKIDSTNRIMPNVIGRLVGVITNLLTSPSDEPTSSGNIGGCRRRHPVAGKSAGIYKAKPFRTTSKSDNGRSRSA